MLLLRKAQNSSKNFVTTGASQVVAERKGFDETAQSISVHGEHGAHQVIVLKKTLIVVWPSAESGRRRMVKLPLVIWLNSWPPFVKRFKFWCERSSQSKQKNKLLYFVRIVGKL